MFLEIMKTSWIVIGIEKDHATFLSIGNSRADAIEKMKVSEVPRDMAIRVYEGDGIRPKLESAYRSLGFVDPVKTSHDTVKALAEQILKSFENVSLEQLMVEGLSEALRRV